jgi:hypothetical protein
MVPRARIPFTNRCLDSKTVSLDFRGLKNGEFEPALDGQLRGMEQPGPLPVELFTVADPGGGGQWWEQRFGHA